MKRIIINKSITIKKEVEELISSADILIEISKTNNELINLYWSIVKLVNDYKRKQF